MHSTGTKLLSLNVELTVGAVLYIITYYKYINFQIQYSKFIYSVHVDSYEQSTIIQYYEYRSKCIMYSYKYCKFLKKYFQFRNFLIIKSPPSIKSIYICLFGPQFLVFLTLKAHANSNQRRLNCLNLLYCTLRSFLSDNVLMNLF